VRNKKGIQQRLERERGEMLRRLDDWLELPMLILSFVWLALLIVELIWGLSPLLNTLSTTIWLLFVLDFLVKFSLAPRKLPYLRNNLLTVIALALPALRVFRIVRVVRVLRATSAARGLRFVRVITSLNRGMKALGLAMRRRGLGYVVALTTLVALGGAAGMYTFERDGGLNSYGEALWWTAMLITSLGSEYWPQTAEGRLLCFILALYGFAVFGYVTATLATFFIGQDSSLSKADSSSSGNSTNDNATLQSLQSEITLLRNEIQALRKRE
jgi:voltage-gated potassium channel